jgi:hypothetical protein
MNKDKKTDFDILAALRSWYDAKSNKHLLLNIIKDIFFISIFLYIGFDANTYCIKQNLPTFKEYNSTNHTFINPMLNSTLILPEK